MENFPILGSDPMDYLSEPLERVDTPLTSLFKIPIRRQPEKPGRELSVVWDKRKPFIEGFETNYAYAVNFTKKGNTAGNHYHHSKEELFVPLIGSVDVFLEDIETKERETHKLDSETFMFIKTNVAHTVRSATDKAVLLVLATYPNNEEDEIHYKVKIK